ncbi:MAG: hypothetical protein H2184_15630 [Candidatus Galacturonibacter soehngenii]|nr:hypothetical protein [Candidatus Galacturonibacter soehngenii]
MKNTVIIVILLVLLTSPIASYAAEKENNVLDYALLIGDSFTAKLEGQGLEEEYHLNIVAYPGITSKELRDNLQAYKDVQQPSKVIILCGINDLILSDKETVSVDGEAELLKNIQERFNVPVYVQLLFPVTELLTIAKPNLTNEKITEYNKQLTELCYQNGYFVIDTRDNFIREDGYLQYTEDGLHIEDQDRYIKNIMKAVSEQEKEIKRLIN